MPFRPTDLKCLLAWYNLGQAGSAYAETNCAVFDASSMTPTYLQLASGSDTLLDGLTKLTIAVDVLVNNAGNYDGWVTRWDINQAQFILRSNSVGAIEFLVASGLSDSGSNYVHSATAMITSGLPARVVVVYDGTLAAGSRAKIFVNGVSVTPTTVGTIPASLTSSSTAKLRVGADFNASDIHDGLISRLCIWAGTALSPNAVLADFNFWIGRDPAGCEPFAPTSAWRLDESSGTRSDCIGSNDLSDVNSNVGSEAHVTQVNDLSGNGFHLMVRPVNGPTYVSSGLNGNPTIQHVAANGQFLVSTIAFPGANKPYAWSLYAVAMCTSATEKAVGSYGLVNTFKDNFDTFTWLVCVLSDAASHTSPGSNNGKIGMGCGDDTFQNQANTNLAVYTANTWFQLTGIFPGGVSDVNVWVDGTSKLTTHITAGGTQACECAGTAHQLVIGSSGAMWTGKSADEDFFDGQWADIAICGADTTSQRAPSGEEDWQNTYGGL